MDFATAANEYGKFSRTENDALALKSTESALLDLFATAGALRQKTQDEVFVAFRDAYNEDKLLALKTMFYTRNIRGGLGERDTFRKMLASAVVLNPEAVVANMHLIPFFGRFDDLYTLIGTPIEEKMWQYLRSVIAVDLMKLGEGNPVSLAGKWLKSTNTSSKKSCELGKKTAKALNMSESVYRKTLSKLRTAIDVIEKKMSSKEWEDIKYSAVPSVAMKNYRKAFGKHDTERFVKYITAVGKGEEVIHSGTLYPYDILLAGELSLGDYYSYYTTAKRGSVPTLSLNKWDAVLEEQWKALPNYVEGENNILVMADTSGSMEGLPMATSVGLAIYFAERNKGAYKDLFLTFSGHPEFVRLKGKTLKEKVSCVPSIVANTNLELAFDLILDLAVSNKVSQEEMPKSLIIISDMQFDNPASCGRERETFHSTMKKKFSAAGYVMPTIVYWMVEERTTGTFQVKKDADSVILVSGHSASTFKAVLGNIGKTPYDFMVETLNSEMYECVTL